MRGVLTTLLSLALSTYSSGSIAAQVRIAVSLPMTGPAASLGLQILPAVQQAVDDLNQQGGVLGNSIELITIDDQCNPPLALMGVRRLIETEQIALLIGPGCASAAAAVVPYIGSMPIRIVNILTSTESALTSQHHSNVFRIVPNAGRQAPIVSEYLQRLNGYNIAILNDQSPYAGEIRNALERAWPGIDAQTKFQTGYSASQTDYSPIIAQLREYDIKVAYIMGTTRSVANLVRQARARGVQSLFVTSEAGASPLLWSIAGESADGMLVSFFPDPARNDQAGPIISRMQKAGRQPSIYGLYAYAAVQSWALATKTAGTTVADKVSSALHDQKFETAAGPVSFDAAGDLREVTYTFYRWENGSIKEVNHRPPPPPPPPPPPSR